MKKNLSKITFCYFIFWSSFLPLSGFYFCFLQMSFLLPDPLSWVLSGKFISASLKQTLSHRFFILIESGSSWTFIVAKQLMSASFWIICCSAPSGSFGGVKSLLWMRQRHDSAGFTCEPEKETNSTSKSPTVSQKTQKVSENLWG